MATPRRVADIRPGSFSSYLRDLTAVGNTLFFSARDDSSGLELWKSDGTAAGTVRVVDIRPGSGDSSPSFLTAVGDTLFFSARDDSSGLELWKSDGTAAGTVQVVDIFPGIYSSSPVEFTAVSDILFFAAGDTRRFGDVSARELWKTNGTAAGTGRIADIWPGPEYGSSPRYLVAVGNTVFFVATEPSSGTELWKSDGTAAGTVRVADILPGKYGSFGRDLAAVGNTLFFSANDGSSGQALWKSDGTAGGTARVADIRPGDAGFDPFVLGDFTAVANTLYFSADDSSSGRELWKTDGTAAGTVLVADINPGVSDSAPFKFTAVGDILFFNADGGSGGRELWKTDGTSAGTMQVAEINPGLPSSNPVELIAVGNTLYFSADDGTSGRELWKSDGTAAGTVRVADIRPGSDGSELRYLTAVGDTLFFSANDGSSGYELWALDLEESDPKRYLCFSGGGFNTHSFLAGFFAGALDVMEARGSEPGAALSDLMANVEGIGAISGGSWFLSHLAYSDAFNQSFDSKRERDSYNSAGYNGVLSGLINAVISAKTPKGTAALRRTINGLQNLLALDPDPVTLFAIDALDALEFMVKVSGFFGEEELDWRSFVENLVYGPFAMKEELANTAFTADRQDWAQQKDLVIATGLSTGDAVLHSNLTFPALPAPSDADPEDSTYTLLGSAEPSLKQAQGRPLGLLSTVSGNGTIRAYADDPVGGDLALSYRSALLPKRRAERTTMPVGGGIPLSPRLSIIDATVASSSALAALAQPEVSGVIGTLLGGQVPLASAFRSLAPMATLRRRGKLELDIPSVTAEAGSLKRQLQNSIAAAEVRLMDGGYLDNAPAAYMLRQIQQEQGSDEPFELTLFFNSSIDPLTGVRMNVAERGRALSDYRLPNDLTQLFGRTTGEAAAAAGSLVDGPFPALTNRMPSAQIFAENAWRGEREPHWQFQQDSVEIRYFELDVRTVANRQFGIVGGQSGRVHLFVSNNSESFAAPYKRSHLDEYRQNYSLAREAISRFGGAELMLEALGVAEPV